MRKVYYWCLGLLSTLIPVEASAHAHMWQLGMQPAVTPVRHAIDNLHTFLMYIMTAVAILVLVLLIYVVVRYSAKRNPNPSKTTHNVLIEIIWTVVPIILLITIAVPSFKLLRMEDLKGQPDVTLKVTGHQWYWSYEYPDLEIASYDSYLIPDKDVDESKGQLRLLSVDNPIIVPTDKVVRVLVTAEDVLHSFAVPAFGVKIDAVPGRLNETWFKIDKPGHYYGQCSELCGTQHGFMPIEVIAVEPEVFERWTDAAKTDVAKAYKVLGSAINAPAAEDENQETN